MSAKGWSGGKGGGGGTNGGFPVFVTGLGYMTNVAGLRAFFAECGEIEYANIATDRETGRSKGMAKVTFLHKEAMQRAVEDWNGRKLDGRTIHIREFLCMGGPGAGQGHADRIGRADGQTGGEGGGAPPGWQRDGRGKGGGGHLDGTGSQGDAASALAGSELQAESLDGHVRRDQAVPGYPGPERGRLGPCVRAASGSCGYLRAGTPKRIDPDDGKAYTLEEIVSKYRQMFTSEEVREYFETDCKPAPACEAEPQRAVAAAPPGPTGVLAAPGPAHRSAAGRQPPARAARELGLGEWLEAVDEQWGRHVPECPKSMGVRQFLQKLEDGYDDFSQILQLYVQRGPDNASVLSEEFFQDAGIEKFGHRRLFTKWICENT